MNSHDYARQILELPNMELTASIEAKGQGNTANKVLVISNHPQSIQVSEDNNRISLVFDQGRILQA